MANSPAKGEVSEQLLHVLRCPRTRQPLERADQTLLERLNRGIAQGSVQHIDGTAVETTLDGALVTSDGKFLYAVLDRIPVLLPDEAIAASDLAG